MLKNLPTYNCFSIVWSLTQLLSTDPPEGRSNYGAQLIAWYTCIPGPHTVA